MLAACAVVYISPFHILLLKAAYPSLSVSQGFAVGFNRHSCVWTSACSGVLHPNMATCSIKFYYELHPIKINV